MAHGETYEEFVDKFKPKKTTDDCYTPPEVYEAVKQWVGDKVMPLEGVEIVRPFYPGGDYEHYDYPEGCLVLDNPPFSILKKIVDFYNARGIRYFLFVPGLVTFSYMQNCNTCIVVNCQVTYMNGAKVNTSFVTNVFPGNPAFVVAGDLHHRLKDLRRGRRKDCKNLPPHKVYPPNIVTAARLTALCSRGECLTVARGECSMPIEKLDCQIRLYGKGVLVSDRLAALLKKQGKEEYVELSDRERQIVASLSGE